MTEFILIRQTFTGSKSFGSVLKQKPIILGRYSSREQFDIDYRKAVVKYPQDEIWLQTK